MKKYWAVEYRDGSIGTNDSKEQAEEWAAADERNRLVRIAEVPFKVWILRVYEVDTGTWSNAGIFSTEKKARKHYVKHSNQGKNWSSYLVLPEDLDPKW